MVEIRKCKRCQYEWALRSDREPETCPRCKSPYWNKERRIGKERATTGPGRI